MLCWRFLVRFFQRTQECATPIPNNPSLMARCESRGLGGSFLQHLGSDHDHQARHLGLLAPARAEKPRCTQKNHHSKTKTSRLTQTKQLHPLAISSCARCMNQAVYFCTGELQPALYAHYGLAMERGLAGEGCQVGEGHWKRLENRMKPSKIKS